MVRRVAQGVDHLVRMSAPPYPVHLILEGRPCLVVGGGRIGARKAAGLLGSRARVHVVARSVGPGVRSLGAAGSPPTTGEHPVPTQGDAGVLSWEERPWRPGDASGYHLAVVAVGDRGLGHQVAVDAEANGVWVNVADDPAAGSFTLPSVLRQGPVTVTVATGGHSPALAVWLRDRLAREVGPEYAVAAELLSAVREELRAAGQATEGLDWQSALDSDMLGLVRAGQVDRARERLRACLSLS